MDQSGATVTATNVNGNQTTAPAFANAGGGDFREAAGSPTLDAGIDSAANGPLDLARTASRIQRCTHRHRSLRASGAARDLSAPPNTAQPAKKKCKKKHKHHAASAKKHCKKKKHP